MEVFGALTMLGLMALALTLAVAWIAMPIVVYVYLKRMDERLRELVMFFKKLEVRNG